MIYFFTYLFLEVMISSSVSSTIGGLNTFLEIVVSAIVGIFILKNFKLSLMESITKARTGKITQEEFIKANVGKAMGAVMLIIPGFFTDIIGILLQFSFLVVLFSKMFHFKTPTNRTTYTTNFDFDASSYKKTNNTNYKRNTDEIIDVEVIDDSKSIKH
ncbi:MAG: FxsA family protein [Arcobacteraceae bacterium]